MPSKIKESLLGTSNRAHIPKEGLSKTGLAGRLWPNGEFTLGKIPPKLKTEKEENFDRLRESQYDSVDQWKSKYGRSFVEEYVFIDPGAQEEVLIGLSTLVNSHKKKRTRKRRGQKGITGKGKRTVRNAAWMLKKAYGRKRLGFLTITLPSFLERPDIMAALITDWSELVRQFTQQLSRIIEKRGFAARWVGVTEIQTGRFGEYEEPAPHLHLIYYAHNGDYQWFISANEVREIWKNILEARVKNLLEEVYEVKTGAAVDMQQVKKDPGRYLSKYMSKGAEVITEMKEKNMASYIPTAWWHCCMKLKKAIIELTVELEDSLKISISRGDDLVGEGLVFYLKEIEVDGKKYGWVGMFIAEGVTANQVKNLLNICVKEKRSNQKSLTLKVEPVKTA